MVAIYRVCEQVAIHNRVAIHIECEQGGNI